MPDQPSKTFFSYARVDSEFTLRLVKDLRAAGASVWLDQLDIAPGELWDGAIENALKTCHNHLIVLSPDAVNSVNVMDEVSFALEQRKKVIPVLYRDCHIPFRLRRVQYIDFRSDYDAGIKELLSILSPHKQIVSAESSEVLTTVSGAQPPHAMMGPQNASARAATRVMQTQPVNSSDTRQTPPQKQTTVFKKWLWVGGSVIALVAFVALWLFVRPDKQSEVSSKTEPPAAPSDAGRKGSLATAKTTQSQTQAAATFPSEGIKGMPGAAVRVKDDPTAEERPYVFTVGSNNHLWLHAWYYDAWHWTDQGSPGNNFVNGMVAAVTVYDSPTQHGRPHAFYRGSDGHLWSNWWRDTWYWNDQGMPTAKGLGPTVSAIVVRDAPSSLSQPYIFIHGNDGRLWLNFYAYAGNSWNWKDQQAPTTLHGELSAIAIRNTVNGPEIPWVFVRGNDGHLWLDRVESGQAHWEDHQTPARVQLRRGPAAVAGKNDFGIQTSVNAFVIGSDGHLWTNWSNGKDWTWSDLQAPRHTQMAGDLHPVVINSVPGSPYVFVKGANGHLLLAWWTGAEWTWSDLGSPEGNAVDAVIASVVLAERSSQREEPAAFIRDMRGHLWMNRRRSTGWRWQDVGFDQ